jgi:hypothetical protein
MTAGPCMFGVCARLQGTGLRYPTDMESQEPITVCSNGPQ